MADDATLKGADAGPAASQKHWLVCTLDLNAGAGSVITLGFFILVNQKERMCARVKVAGPAFNPCPSVPETQWMEIWH